MADKKATKRGLSYDVEGHGEVVFEQPEQGVYTRLMDQLQDDNIQTSAAMIAFIKSCHVSGPLVEILADYPAFINTAGGDLQDLARPAAQAIVKKG